AHDEPRVVAVETGEAPGDFATIGVGDGDSVAALKTAGDLGDADGQERATLAESADGAGVELQGSGNGERAEDPAFSRLGAGGRRLEEGVEAAFGEAAQGMGFGALGDDHGGAGQGRDLAGFD